jgi:biopolymer transport protein TolR
MLQSWRRPVKLFSDFNTLQFAAVASLVVFVLLLVFMVHGEPFHSGSSVDLAKVDHPVSMPNANREDAMKFTVTRDGKIYFETGQVTADDIREKVVDRLKDHTVERKVYILADMRARWGAVKPVLDGVRAAGVLRVAFLVGQRHAAAFHM